MPKTRIIPIQTIIFLAMALISLPIILGRLNPFYHRAIPASKKKGKKKGTILFIDLDYFMW